MIQVSNLQKSKQRIRFLEAITVIFFFIVLLGCASGSSIIAGNVRPAISSNEVQIYVEPPAQYETIGIVEATGNVGFSRQSTQNKVIGQLKSRAAKMGANGVLLILTNTGSQSSGTTGFYSNGIFYGGASDKIIAQGRAIYIIQE
jgi:hypothetical protein